MKQLLVLIAIVIGVSAVIIAAPNSEDKKPTPVAVVVAVEGFHCQACPDALQQDLAKVDGVSEVKATLAPPMVSAKIDESKITAGEFVAKIAAHPQEMDAKKTYGAKLVVCIDAPMCAKNPTMCPACFTEIPKVLKKIKGVSDVSLDKTGKIATIGFKLDAKVTTVQLATALGKHSFKFTADFACPQYMQTHADEQKDGMTCPMGQGAADADGCCGGGK